MLNIKSFKLTEDNFVQQTDIFVATIKHDLNTDVTAVTVSGEQGSVIYDYQKPDLNHIHILMVEPCAINVNIMYRV